MSALVILTVLLSSINLQSSYPEYRPTMCERCSLSSDPHKVLRDSGKSDKDKRIIIHTVSTVISEIVRGNIKTNRIFAGVVELPNINGALLDLIKTAHNLNEDLDVSAKTLVREMKDRARTLGYITSIPTIKLWREKPMLAIWFGKRDREVISWNHLLRIKLHGTFSPTTITIPNIPVVDRISSLPHDIVDTTARIIRDHQHQITRYKTKQNCGSTCGAQLTWSFTANPNFITHTRHGFRIFNTGVDEEIGKATRLTIRGRKHYLWTPAMPQGFRNIFNGHSGIREVDLMTEAMSRDLRRGCQKYFTSVCLHAAHNRRHQYVRSAACASCRQISIINGVTLKLLDNPIARYEDFFEFRPQAFLQYLEKNDRYLALVISHAGNIKYCIARGDHPLTGLADGTFEILQWYQQGAKGSPRAILNRDDADFTLTTEILCVGGATPDWWGTITVDTEQALLRNPASPINIIKELSPTKRLKHLGISKKKISKNTFHFLLQFQRTDITWFCDVANYPEARTHRKSLLDLSYQSRTRRRQALYQQEEADAALRAAHAKADAALGAAHAGAGGPPLSPPRRRRTERVKTTPERIKLQQTSRHCSVNDAPTIAVEASRIEAARIKKSGRRRLEPHKWLRKPKTPRKSPKISLGKSKRQGENRDITLRTSPLPLIFGREEDREPLGELDQQSLLDQTNRGSPNIFSPVHSFTQ